MSDTIRLTPMRGFAVSVARGDCATPQSQHSCIAIGLDRQDGTDDAIALSLRHADGTTLVAYLDDAHLGRLADLLRTAVAGGAASTIARLQ